MLGRESVGAHLCATSRRSDASWRGCRAQVRSHRKAHTFPQAPAPHPGGKRAKWSEALLWERTLCATSRRSDTSQRCGRAQGALLQTIAAPDAVVCQSQCEARPRFKSSAIGPVAQRTARHRGGCASMPARSTMHITSKPQSQHPPTATSPHPAMAAPQTPGCTRD